MIDHSQEESGHPLFPHQRKFLESYFAEGDFHIRCLIAPPGTGSTYTVVELARRLLDANRASRILILVDPKDSIFQINALFRSLGTNAMIMDRFRYRELEDLDRSQQSAWTPYGIYLSTVQFAAQSDIRQGMLATEWDLAVIINAPPRQGWRNGEFLSDLASCPKTRSAVFVLNAPLSSVQGTLPEAAVLTEWHLRDLVGIDGRPLWNPETVKLEPFSYQLTETEIEIQNGLNAISDLVLKLESDQPDPTDDLPQFGAYDPYNSEFQLRFLHSQLRQRRNALAHSKVAQASEDTLSLFDDTAQQVEQMLEMIEGQETDSKLEGLIKRLTQASVATSRIVITTRYRVTAEYLASSLEPHFEPLSVLSGSASLDERHLAIQRYRERGGIIIATEAVLEGVSIVDADILIPYEIPRSAHGALVLVSRFLRMGRTKPLTILSPDGRGYSDVETGDNLFLLREALEQINGEEPEIN